MEKLTKLNVAKREVNAAIRMYFLGEDPVAVHVVIASGLDILRDLARKKGLQVGSDFFLNIIRPEKRKEFEGMWRQPQGFFKHANRKGSENEVLDYNPLTVEMYLLMGARAYLDFTHTQTPEIHIFCNYFYMNYPEVLNDSVFKEEIMKAAGTLDIKDKVTFSDSIKRIRNNKLIDNLDYS